MTDKTATILAKWLMAVLLVVLVVLVPVLLTASRPEPKKQSAGALQIAQDRTLTYVPPPSAVKKSSTYQPKDNETWTVKINEHGAMYIVVGSSD